MRVKYVYTNIWHTFCLLFIDMLANLPFTEEQKEYLIGRVKSHYPFLWQNTQGQFTNTPGEDTGSVYGYQIDDLCKEERVKHEKNGLDVWDNMVKNDQLGQFPDEGDTFRYKFYGMFHVKPIQDSFMLRMRIPGGKLNSLQFRGIAEMAADWAGGYANITTRGNFQLREIMPNNVINVLQKLTDLGLTSRGAGADNVRNVTANPTSGFDKQELLDVMPYAKAMHHTIMNNRDLYGLPRKFNIAFDGGGEVSTAADSNDIGFYATEVKEGHGVEPGIYFRMQLCGISGHKQLASDSGLLIKPDESVAIASAILRVFLENGCRDNRKKARFKYLVDDWGIEKVLEAVQEKLAFPLVKFAEEDCEPFLKKNRIAHVGVHAQSQENLSYVGILTPVGILKPEQMHKIADLADKYGQSDIRLTIWQNIIIPHISNDKVEELLLELQAAGLKTSASSICSGLIACTGNTGCKFAAANTKANSVELSAYLDSKFNLDKPLNIHVTGCPNSCAQHYCGDIGLQGVQCKVDGETVEGYNIVVGGGMDDINGIGKDLFQSIPATEIPVKIEFMLNQYLENRQSKEAFLDFTRRHSTEELIQLFSA